MLANLKYSLLSIFDLYQNANKYYQFSLYFALISVTISVMLSALVSWLGGQIFYMEEITGASLIDQITSPFLFNHFSALYVGLIVISLGLYAVYLKRKQGTGEVILSVGDFKDVLSDSNWNSYLVVTGLYCFLYLATFKDLFVLDSDVGSDDSGILGLTLQFGEEFGAGNSRLAKLYLWLNSLIVLIKNYLPYAGAFYIVLSDYYPKPSIDILKAFLKPLFVILILGFCVDGISYNLLWYIDLYVLKLVEVAFKEQFIYGGLKFIVYFFGALYFYPAIAGVFFYPVDYKNSELQQRAEAKI